MKRIGIIGVGQIGSTLARKFSTLGHNVKIANSRGPHTLTNLATEIGVSAVTINEAIENVDIVIISIPQKKIQDLPADLFAGSPQQLIIVETGNYYPYRDGKMPELEAELTESEWVSKHLSRPVLKAFNNIGANSLADNGRPSGDLERIALPVSGNSSQDKAIILNLIDQLGFDGVDAGLISESWRQQPGSPVYCTDHNFNDIIDLVKSSDRSMLAEMREKGVQMVMQSKEPFKESRDILRALFPKLPTA
ncbi:MAG: NADP oxidoreductase [Pedobacter sp.]|nr:MAG: NADP oxidoreductase [Pedobacter sp.]